MKSMVPTLSAIVALIAMTNAAVVDYSETALTELKLTNSQKGSLVARVVNPGNTYMFKPVGETEQYTVVLAPEASSAVGNPDQKICKPFSTGIILNHGEKTLCDITLFGMKIDSVKENIHTIQFFAVLESDTSKPLILDIPIFQIPSEFSSMNQNKLAKWATENKVGLLAPIDLAKLKAIRENKAIPLDFKWLAELFDYGIFEGGSSRLVVKVEGQMDLYVTRPVVLPHPLIDEFIKVVQALAPEKELPKYLEAFDSQFFYELAGTTWDDESMENDSPHAVIKDADNMVMNAVY